MEMDHVRGLRTHTYLDSIQVLVIGGRAYKMASGWMRESNVRSLTSTPASTLYPLHHLHLQPACCDYLPKLLWFVIFMALLILRASQIQSRHLPPMGFLGNYIYAHADNYYIKYLILTTGFVSSPTLYLLLHMPYPDREL